MQRRYLVVFPIVVATLLQGSFSEYLSARRKFALIEADGLRPGARVSLTERELNAYVRQDLARRFPQGVRDLGVSLGTGTATGAALVDFGKVRRAQGNPPGWLTSKLLDGERPVRVTARIRSAGGRATVDVQSVDISGMTIDGPVLEYLIQNYLTPHYPEARIGAPFALGHRIDHLEIRPGAVAVVIGGG